MNLKTPLVSICLPLYNGEKFLQEALDSVSNQTYENIELIVSGDNSIDNSLNIINDFKRHVNFPVFVYHHQPFGIGANWNNCVMNSNGDYIKFLFQDDVITSNCIEEMMNYAKLNDKIGIVYSKRHFLYDNNNLKVVEWIKTYGNLHLSWKENKIKDGIINKGVDLLKDKDLFSSPLNKIGEPTAVLLKKEVFGKIGFFSQELKQTLDVDFWLKVMKYYDVILIDKKLVSFRLHDQQTTSINTDNNLDESLLFFKSMYENLFWNLSFKNRCKLFLDYHIIGRFFKKFIKLKKILLFQKR